MDVRAINRKIELTNNRTLGLIFGCNGVKSSKCIGMMSFLSGNKHTLSKAGLVTMLKPMVLIFLIKPIEIIARDSKRR